jgi:PAS domain S-box-containing protein
LFVGILLFVRFYMGAGRSWLIWTIIAVRGAILLLNFALQRNFNFQRIVSIERVRFLGEQITVVGDSTPGSWQWLATAACVLCIAFIADASVTLWRRGAPDDRRKALVVGGGTIAFTIIAVAYTQLVIWGFGRLPMLITPAFSGMFAAMAFELSRDMFHASKLARGLLESETNLELAANAARLGFCAWDGVDHEIWATDRGRSLLGFTKADKIDGARLLQVIHVDDAARVREVLRRALAREGEYSVQFRICLPDGATRWLAARGNSQCATIDKPSLRGVLCDITNQRRVQDEADELRSELAYAGRVTMLGQLVSSLTHELRQPLSAILRNSEAAQIVLKKSSPDLCELRAIVEDIHMDDRRAGEVIDRLHALLKRRQMDFQPIALESLMKEVSAIVRFDAAARHVMLESEVGPALPAIRGDRVHLSQVLINLIINGVDATAALTGSCRRVRIGARVTESRLVEVAVTDSGAGIPPERMSRIFEPFFTTKPGGMGMGLCVSRTIIEAHGGRLWAENNVQGGAKFCFTLSLAHGEPA